MKHILNDRKGVSNILGYLFSFSVASILMVSAVLITTGILNNKTASVANLQAQSIANKVADAIVEAITVGQSISNEEYKRTLDLPTDIAGRGYYVDITDTMVYVNTTDGLVSKSCSTYTAEDLKIGVGGGRTYGSAGKLNISVDKSDTLYKFDFGAGNMSKHSPVESGYYFVSNTSNLNTGKPQDSTRDPPWWNESYRYRVPILINNISPEDLVNVPIKIVLNTSNFDYSHANVNFTSSSNVTSDLVFYEPSNSILARIEITQKDWDPDWFYTHYDPNEDTGTVTVTIKELSEGYNVSYINGDTIKLNGNVNKKSWNANTGVASFSGKKALESLENGKHFLKQQSYTVTVSGLLKNGVEFFGSYSISINAKYVSQTDPGNSIQTAIDGLPSTGGTVFVYNGVYWQSGVLIDKPLNLIGESRDSTILHAKSSNGFLVESATNVNIDSFYSYPGVYPIGHGILVEGGSSNINITNCKIAGYDDCIEIQSSSNVGITQCITNNSVGDPGTGKYGEGIDVYNGGAQIENRVRITNCECKYHNTINGNGIQLYYAKKVDIINCKCHDNAEEDGNGIQLSGSLNCKVINCSCYNLAGFQADGITINDDSQNHQSKNNTIKDCITWGNTGESSEQGRGITILDPETTLNTIVNCTSYGNDIGIFVQRSSYNNISNCDVYANTKMAICIYGLGDNMYTVVSNCSVHDNGDENLVSGIYIGGSKKNTIQNCNIYQNNNKGIALITANDNKIRNCNIYKNLDGIMMSAVNNTYVEYCNIFDNLDDGIEIVTGSGTIWYNQIQFNNIYCNVAAGIFIEAASQSNTIYKNNFYKNGKNPNDTPPIPNYGSWSNAYDGNPNVISYVNDWNYNYWDDYGSEPHHENGVYMIGPWHYDTGWQSSRDYYPHTSGFYNLCPPFFQVNSELYVWPDLFHRQTISSAMVNLCNNFASGTILVYQVTDPYINEHIEIKNQNVKLIGVGTVIVDSGSLDPVIEVTKSGVSIEGLTIQNGETGIYYNNVQNYPASSYKPLNITNCKILSNNINYPDTGGYGIKLGGQINNYCIVKNCLISGNNNCGISIASNKNRIINCSIYDNGYGGVNGFGVYIENGDSNKITNCTIHHNRFGFYITTNSDNNIINNSKIDSNQNQGIYISGSSNTNVISNCTIMNNPAGITIVSSNYNKIMDSVITMASVNGISIGSSSLWNSMTYCNITGGGNGVSIGAGSNHDNSITNCSIYNNNYGVNIQTGATNTNNKIYHNDIRNNRINASDDGSNNKWNDSYPSGGNLWGNYDEYREGARDYKRGSKQDRTGSDGIADTPYSIGSANDYYPLCQRPFLRPYFIDYWNPYGESVILLNMSIGALTSKYINLYYGYDKALNDFHKHNMSEISVFFDDFNSQSLFDRQWSNQSSILENSCVNIANQGDILTNYGTYTNFIKTIGTPTKKILSSTTNESMYIIEAKMKINRGQGNMILFPYTGQTSSSTNTSYLISANLTPSNKLSLQKWYHLNLPPTPASGSHGDQLDNVSSSNLSNWIRMKSYVYQSKTYYCPYSNPGDPYYQTDVTYIRSYVYDYNTYAILSYVSGSDGYCYQYNPDVPPSNPPDDKALGYPFPSEDHTAIGMQSGECSSLDSNILVDWFRVIKSPIVPPIVTIGSIESINYGWTSGIIKAWNTNTFDPFKPGPILRDSNYGNYADKGIFTIKYLPAGKYTITVTKGNYTNISSVTYVKVTEQGYPQYAQLTIPSTKNGKFETEWITITKKQNGIDLNYDLNIEFSTDTIGGKWTVNSLIIDRGWKGVKVGLE
jgi:parallel beta-helix repeat protein